jgi:hypothetical protein
MRHFLLAAAFFLLAGKSNAQFIFKDATQNSGISMNSTGASDAGPGVIITDINNDGWDDVYMCGGLDSDKLFVNMQDGTFRNILPLNIASHTADDGPWRAFPIGGIAFDYDNDGFTDLYLASMNKDFLWHNNGDGTFTNTTRTAQLNSNLDNANSIGATFGDFNGDGFNDFYVARGTSKNYFYINNGNGTFSEHAADFHVANDSGKSNIALFFDFDRDGDLDLVLGNDSLVTSLQGNNSALIPNRIFKNMLMETGQATFLDVSHTINADAKLFSHSITPCDYDNDGNFDFYGASYGGDILFHNQKNSFSVKNTLPPEASGNSRTAILGDFDNDASEDAFILHGNGSLSTNDTSQFLRNLNGAFVNVAYQALGGKVLTVNGAGAAYLDFNHDGKLDLCIGSSSSGPTKSSSDFRILQNVSSVNSRHWIEMRFIAKHTAKEAIGTIVDVWAGGVVHSRQVSTGGGLASQNSLMQHVGLAESTKADSIIVYWPANRNLHRQIDKYYDVGADTTLQFIEYVNPSSLILPSKSYISIFPSVVDDALHINNLSANLQHHIKIINLLGITKYEQIVTGKSPIINTNNFTAGFYRLLIESNNECTSFSFIKK